MAIIVTGGVSVTAEKQKTDIEKISDNFDKYIVRPANLFGLGGFVFDIERETVLRQNAEITDHYVEDNTAVQDHIAIRPIRLSLRNFVGELIYENDDRKTLNQVQEVVRKLTVLDAFIPELSTGAQQARDLITSKKATDFNSLTSGVLDLWSLTKNLNPGANKQQQAYLYFEALMQQKIKVSVQTPFKYLTDMYIESITAIQGENSRFLSDFQINLKQVRTTSLQIVKFDIKKYQSRSGQQAAPQVDNGKAQGKVRESSVLANIADSYRGQ